MFFVCFFFFFCLFVCFVCFFFFVVFFFFFGGGGGGLVTYKLDFYGLFLKVHHLHALSPTGSVRSRENAPACVLRLNLH